MHGLIIGYISDLSSQPVWIYALHKYPLLFCDWKLVLCHKRKMYLHHVIIDSICMSSLIQGVTHRRQAISKKAFKKCYL